MTHSPDGVRAEGGRPADAVMNDATRDLERRYERAEHDADEAAMERELKHTAALDARLGRR